MRYAHLAFTLLLTLFGSSRAQTAGSAWAALDGGLGGSGVHTFEPGPDGRLYVGGAFERFDLGFSLLAAWDGAAWSGIGPFDPENPYGAFYDLTFGADGRLYVAGDFDRLDGRWMASLAVWDGVEWASVGGGVHNEPQPGDYYGGLVQALAWDAAGVLYAGGDFNRTGPLGSGRPVGLVAAWDSAVWRAVGGAGLGHADGGRAEVRALAFGPDGRLYAGGDFTTADGQPVANVAAWDGTAWDDLDGGLPGSAVTALVFGPDGRLYADASGTVAGTETDIAAWDGTAWAPVGPPVQGAVGSLAFGPDGKLYAAGNFTLPDGSEDVARLDGYLAGPAAGVWVPLGGGVTYSFPDAQIVYALAVGAQGEVYVGGTFDRVWQAPGGPSVAANNVAVWWGDATVGGEDGPAAGGLALSVSPNPSRGPATVAVTLVEAQAVRVVVADVLGREVAVVFDGALPAGTHALAVDVSRWPAGVYAVRAEAGDASSSARLTVVR